MIQWLISRRYYLLTSLTLLLGTLVLVVTLALATASYLRSIDKTVAGYGHMLSSLDAALIHELVLARQPALGHCPPDQARQPLHLLLPPADGPHQQLPGLAAAGRVSCRQPALVSGAVDAGG